MTVRIDLDVTLVLDRDEPLNARQLRFFAEYVGSVLADDTDLREGDGLRTVDVRARERITVSELVADESTEWVDVQPGVKARLTARRKSP